MSIDAYLVIDTGGAHPAYITSGRNYTHNVSGMWTEAMKRTGLCPTFHTFYDMLEGGVSWMPDPEKPGYSIPTGNRLTPPKAGDLIPILRAMIAEMEVDDESFIDMNPPNGWGDYDGAISFLREFLDDCLTHPLAHVRVSI